MKTAIKHRGEPEHGQDQRIGPSVRRRLDDAVDQGDEARDRQDGADRVERRGGRVIRLRDQAPPERQW